MLNLEIEYYGSPYWNTSGGPDPLPGTLPEVMEGDGHRDDWKFSVTAQKKFFERLTISGKVASDHLRTTDPNGWPDSSPRLFAISEWYWAVKAAVSF